MNTNINFIHMFKMRWKSDFHRISNSTKKVKPGYYILIVINQTEDKMATAVDN